MFTIRFPLTRHVSLRRMMLPEDTCDPSRHPAPVSHSPGHQPERRSQESFEYSNKLNTGICVVFILGIFHQLNIVNIFCIPYLTHFQNRIYSAFGISNVTIRDNTAPEHLLARLRAVSGSSSHGRCLQSVLLRHVSGAESREPHCVTSGVPCSGLHHR